MNITITTYTLPTGQRFSLYPRSDGTWLMDAHFGDILPENEVIESSCLNGYKVRQRIAEGRRVILGL